MREQPGKTPDAPTPAMALPMMSASECGAVAHTMDPNSKSTSASKNTFLIEKKVYSFPYARVRVAVVRRYADVYHPMSSSAWKSSVIAGTAVVMMVWSYC
jgi:hypothetical protein